MPFDRAMRGTVPHSIPPARSQTRVPAFSTLPARGRVRLARHLALACLAAACGCSSDRPTAPRAHALSGHVVLSGPFVDAAGNPAGTRVLGDADGVAVELLDGNRVLAHTTTTAGVYRFAGLGSGVYTTRARVNDAVEDETNPLTIANADLASADTLHLAASGDLYPVPNPVVDSTVVTFNVDPPGYVTIRILGAAGDTVRTLLLRVGMSGLNTVVWDGRDQAGAETTARFYWMTFEEGSDVRAQLLFRP